MMLLPLFFNSDTNEITKLVYKPSNYEKPIQSRFFLCDTCYSSDDFHCSVFVFNTMIWTYKTEKNDALCYTEVTLFQSFPCLRILDSNLYISAPYKGALHSSSDRAQRKKYLHGSYCVARCSRHSPCRDARMCLRMHSN